MLTNCVFIRNMYMSKSSITKGASVEKILPDRWHSLRSVMYKYQVENVKNDEYVHIWACSLYRMSMGLLCEK